MFRPLKPYKNFEPAGVKLPTIDVDGDTLARLGLPQNSAAATVLRKLCEERLNTPEFTQKPRFAEYKERLELELGIFEELGFVDYVLLNWDVMNFCHKSGIITGAGRGSAPSSLCLYLLNVTRIDPIEGGLFFERFVSKSRAQKAIGENGEEFLVGNLLPDVDSDISFLEREQVIKYIEDKHKGRTSKILTFNTFSSKLCVKECAKFFSECNEEDANHVSGTIPKLHGKVSSLKDSLEESGEFHKWVKNNRLSHINALKIEGLNKNVGIHPSGIAICHTEIDTIMPLQSTKEGELVSGYDMNDVADLMVKFDILGLRTLAILAEACRQIGLDVYGIDENDPFIYEKLQDFKHPAGLFQISAETNFRVCQDVRPNGLQELSDVVALARPASLQFVDEYVKQKLHPEKMGLNDKLDAILADSKNVILFQESLMFIAHEVFGLSLDEAEILRRIVGKKKRDEMPKWKDRIYQGAEDNNVDIRVADFYWGGLEAAADYSFNKCIFEEETVETPTGKQQLNKIKIGDSVLAFDSTLSKDHFVEVVDIISGSQELYLIELENGRHIRASLDHKFLTQEMGMQPIKVILAENLSIASH